MRREIPECIIAFFFIDRTMQYNCCIVRPESEPKNSLRALQLRHTIGFNPIAFALFIDPSLVRASVRWSEASINAADNVIILTIYRRRPLSRLAETSKSRQPFVQGGGLEMAGSISHWRMFLDPPLDITERIAHLGESVYPF